MTNPIKALFHCICLLILCLDKFVVSDQNTTIPVNVGVVLDFDNVSVGRIGWSCINMALSDFYETHGGDYKTRLVLKVRDSKEDVVAAAAAALDLIKNVEVQAIIGPTTSMQTNFVINLGNKSKVPIIAFSASSPSLASLRSPYFFRAAQDGSFQVKAISAIVQTFGWREAVPIYVDNQFGESIIPCLTEALEQINARVPYLSIISQSAIDDEISAELYRLMAMSTRVFILHMEMSLGSRVLTHAKQIGMMEKGFVWILTDTMTAQWSSTDSSPINSMQGVLGVRTYVPKLKKLEDFQIRWKRKFQQDYPEIVNTELNLFGLWAYDATFALAMAIEKASTSTASNFQFKKTNVSSSAVDLEAFGVSQNGPKIIEALSSIRFTGLTGEFHFKNRQLHSDAFQIVNINGNGENSIGFWTPENGLEREINSMNNARSASASKSNLGPIIWPGDTVEPPRGWDFPSKGSKLRIGVPVKDGFKEFVQMTWDPVSHKATSIEGYCIDIFKAVMDKMPYAVPYEFIPFATPDGKSAGSYNDLIDQVYFENYDAVVGDVTIVANRSLYVDFTLPYTESGVSMLVPIKDQKKKNAWVFLKPLTGDLWITSCCFFLFIGFVVWVLEHRINQDFRGSPARQVGTSFCFSLSTMVFAHRERVESNLARFVIIIWCFVVLILTQSYTASLTSLLTIEHLQPTVTDINELLKRREGVGYYDGSFVEEILFGLNFHDFQLKKYESAEELHELFAKGSANGGISAAFDEIPYFKDFLAKYCGKYTMVDPTFRTAGFGFVFRKGSPLVTDVSEAILKVTQSEEMKQIEDKWFNKESVFPSLNPSMSSNSLGLESFWGLFLIAGTASMLALIVFLAMFLYEQRHVLLQSDSETSILRRIRIMSRIFDQKDLSSHTFQNKEGSSNAVSTVQNIGLYGSSPNSTSCPPSPSSCSYQTDSSEFVFFVEQGRSLKHEHLSTTPSGSASPDIFPSPERYSFEIPHRN